MDGFERVHCNRDQAQDLKEQWKKSDRPGLQDHSYFRVETKDY